MRAPIRVAESLGDVLIFLIHPLNRHQRGPLAEERLDRLRREVAVPGADVDQERIRRRHRAREGSPEARIHRPAHLVLDLNAMGGRRG